MNGSDKTAEKTASYYSYGDLVELPLFDCRRHRAAFE